MGQGINRAVSHQVVVAPAKSDGFTAAVDHIKRVRKKLDLRCAQRRTCMPMKDFTHHLPWAAQHHADLIVMGAKGLGAIARFLLGSVSTRVVQHASCSVL
ncbi:MAG: universal stress protein, partial [Nitrospiraceae bacterium]